MKLLVLATMMTLIATPAIAGSYGGNGNGGNGGGEGSGEGSPAPAAPSVSAGHGEWPAPVHDCRGWGEHWWSARRCEVPPTPVLSVERERLRRVQEKMPEAASVEEFNQLLRKGSK